MRQTNYLIAKLNPNMVGQLHPHALVIPMGREKSSCMNTSYEVGQILYSFNQHEVLLGLLTCRVIS